MKTLKPQFVSDLVLTPLGDGGKWRVESNLHFVSAKLGLITVEAGFVTDLASIPRLFWNIWPPQSIAAEAVLHDWGYAGRIPGVTRAQVDALLLEAMKSKRRSAVKQAVIYRMVRLFAGGAWRGK